MGIGFTNRITRTIFIVVMMIGMILRVSVALQPVNELVEKNLPDDAYYYFAIAHNIAQSGSVSLNGEGVTNGFHPLWLLLLLGIFGWNTPLGDLQVHMALFLAAILDVVTIWVIAQITIRTGRNENLGLVASALYALNPVVILQATNGLETALAMLTLTSFLWFLIQLLNNDKKRSLVVWVGVFLGLAFLSRSDSIFTLGIAMLIGFFAWGFSQGLRKFIVIGGIASLLVIPWFLWSYFATGSFIQESGIAVPIAIRHRLILSEGEESGVLLNEVIKQLTHAPFWLRGDPTGLPFVVGIILWIAVLVGLAWRWKNFRMVSMEEKLLLISLFGGGLVLYFFHAGLRWYPRIWYFSSMSITFSIIAALVVQPLLKHRRLFFYLSLFLCVYYFISGYLIWRIGYYPWQREMLAASHWLANNYAEGEKVGSFNAGIYAYYSGMKVYNLDGVVNHDAFLAFRESRILSYLNQNGVSYLIDYDSAINGEYRPFLGARSLQQLRELAVLGGDSRSMLGLLRIYEVLVP